MKIGMIGLGKMGANMSDRLLQGGHQVVVYDLKEAAIKQAELRGAVGARTIDDLISFLNSPRVIWIMVPAGNPTEAAIETLSESLSENDIIIDGGNSYYKDSIRHASELKAKGIHLIDVGTSGGVWGLTEGYCMMVGGEGAPIKYIHPVLETLAPNPSKGWGHVGPSGSGHFVKMVHNGIEYGMMQAYAEGFEIMKAKGDFKLDLHQIAEIWRTGSVIRSWLLDLTADALAEDPELSGIKDWVADSGEGRWTVLEAIDLDVPAPVITLSLQARFTSRQEQSYAAKLLAAMRNQFGGHAIKRDD